VYRIVAIRRSIAAEAYILTPWRRVLSIFSLQDIEKDATGSGRNKAAGAPTHPSPEVSEDLTAAGGNPSCCK
jgi:hypothetical protein